jgi:micrococcal nuclease
LSNRDLGDLMDPDIPEQERDDAVDAPGGPTADAGLATVARIVDGDTLIVDIGGSHERVRLIGIDTPEVVAWERPVECYGAEASERMAELLPIGTEVRLERDAVPRDRYDRLLAYVWRVEDEVLVNLVMVEEGYAAAVTFGDNEALYRTLSAAEADARADARGLWGACGGPDVPIGPPPGPPE